MRSILTLPCAVILLSGPIGAEDSNPGLPAKNVVLIGWDGAQRAHILECLERGELPTMKRLSEQGGLVSIDVVNGATDTKAGWSQILTGYNPGITGVFSNGRFRDIPEGYSVFERLEKQFGSDRFVTVAVIGKSGHCGEIRAPFKKELDASGKATGAPAGAGKKPQGKVVEENGKRFLVFEGSPYYTMHKSCDVWEYGLMLDQKVGTRAIQLLEQYKDKPFFFFVHFAEVDHSGHKHGENSKEYNDALISNDTWTGKIIDKLKELGLYDKTLVYVTSDHGFNEGASNHKYAPYVVCASNDPRLKRDGMRQDITPTILADFGLNLADLDPALSGEPLTAPATKPVLKAPEKAAATEKSAAPKKKKKK